jgi:hypothetical protein
MDDYLAGTAVRQRYELLKPAMDERLRRLWAAAEALALGTGGVSLLANVTGLSQTTIRSGIEELRHPEAELAGLTREGRSRRPGAGRKSLVEQDETLIRDLEALLESSEEEASRPLDWTCKSLRGLAGELAAIGHPVSYRTVGNLLHRRGYRFSPSESYKRFSVAHRREQYRLISRRASWFLRSGEPIVSLGLVAGLVEREGQDHRQPLTPERRTADLAASVLLHWWRHSGSRKYLRARRLLVITDTSGLPEGDRTLWAPLLQPLADESGLEIAASHFPPGAWCWRRSVGELTCSCFQLEEGREGKALTLDLDLIHLASGEVPARSPAALHGPGELRDDFWNYRITGRSRASTG